MKKRVVLGFVFLFIFTIVSAADNLCLDDTGWDVDLVTNNVDLGYMGHGALAVGSSISAGTLPVTRLIDGDYHTYLDVSDVSTVNHLNVDFIVEFPSPVPEIELISFKYHDWSPSSEKFYNSVFVYSNGIWTDIGGSWRTDNINCTNERVFDTNLFSAEHAVYPSTFHPMHYTREREVNCTGSYKNVEKIKVNFLAKSANTPYTGDGWNGFRLREIEALSVFPPVGSLPAVVPYSDDDVIMRLSNWSNAHGALWNETSYTVPIFYSDIFPEYPMSGYDLHSCTGSNFVLGLNDVINAHAAGLPGIPNYDTSVCYGDLICDLDFAQVGDSDCQDFGGRLIASLNEQSNAHIYYRNSTHHVPSDIVNYPYQLCCKVSGFVGGPSATCGDGIIDSGESCDNSNLSSYTCASLGYTGGSLACDASCGFDISGCTDASTGVCGDGIIDSGESCDGTNISSTCVSLGYTGGSLACDASCNHDLTGCSSASVPPSGAYWADTEGNPITQANFGDTVLMYSVGGTSGVFDIYEDDLVFNDEIVTGIFGKAQGVNYIGKWTIPSRSSLAVLTSDFSDFMFRIDGAWSNSLEIVYGSDSEIIVDLVSPSCGLYFDESDIVEIVIAASDSDDIIEGSVFINGNEVKTFGNGGVVFNYTFASPGNVSVIVDASNERGRIVRDFSNVMVLDKEAGNYVDGKYVAACILKPEDSSDISGHNVSFDASTTRAIDVVSGIVNHILPGSANLIWNWRFMPEDREVSFSNDVSSDPYNFVVNFPRAGHNSAELSIEVI
jgi:hypothetical protein